MFSMATYSFGPLSEENSQWKMITGRRLIVKFALRTASAEKNSCTIASFEKMFNAP